MSCKARHQAERGPGQRVVFMFLLRSRDVRGRILTPRVRLIGLNFSAKLAKMAKEIQEKSSLQLRLFPCEEVP